MNCPKCGTPAQSGVSHCRRCGAALAAKAPAAAASDEIDLMPLEESRIPTHSAFEPPPDLVGPPPTPGTKSRAKPAPFDPAAPPPPEIRGKIRGAMASPKSLNINAIVGGVIALVVLGWVGWLVFRTKNELKAGKAKVEQTFMIQPNQLRIENLDVSGKMTYTLEVTAPDTEILVGVFQRSPKDPATVAALKALPEGFETVKKGDNYSKTSDLTNGQYTWAVVNDGKKAARAKVKFSIAK